MVKETIQKNIKKYRMEKGLTQKAFGELIGKSETTVGDYENGRTDITVSALEKIAEALNIPVCSLIDDNYNSEVPFYDESVKLRIYIKEDRLQVAKILIENGYTVGQSKEKRTETGKIVDYYLKAKLDEANADTTK